MLQREEERKRRRGRGRGREGEGSLIGTLGADTKACTQDGERGRKGRGERAIRLGGGLATSCTPRAQIKIKRKRARERESERESARERERATKGERESEKGREGEQERERERARQGDGEIETERVLSVETLAQTHTYSRFQCANAYIFAYVFALSTCIHRPPVSWGGIGDTRYWRCR